MPGALRDSRVSVPPLAPGHTTRPRLLRALDAATRSPLTVVAAGPGWGKTALLTEWAYSQTEPVAWLSLDARQNEPRRFWSQVAAALANAGLAEHDHDGDLASQWPDVLVEEQLDAFFDTFGSESGRFVLVLDDAHELTIRTCCAISTPF